MDWHSRKVLSWRLSNTLDTELCVEALREALQHYGTPEIFSTDQGCQFTSETFPQVLKDAGIQISMDGKGRWVGELAPRTPTDSHLDGILQPEEETPVH